MSRINSSAKPPARNPLVYIVGKDAYDVFIDYRRERVPPLDRADAAWAAKMLRKRGLR